MAAPKASLERLGGFSDGVIAIIITIMVLELKVPHDTNPRTLLEEWPMFLAYGLSYLFTGVFWANHHYLLRFAGQASHSIVGANLLVLFFVSLIPFFTGYLAENQMAAFPVAIYSALFFLVTAGFILLHDLIVKQSTKDTESVQECRASAKRNWLALAAYGLAVPAAYLFPPISLVIIAVVVGLYFVPDLVERHG